MWRQVVCSAHSRDEVWQMDTTLQRKSAWLRVCKLETPQWTSMPLEMGRVWRSSAHMATLAPSAVTVHLTRQHGNRQMGHALVLPSQNGTSVGAAIPMGVATNDWPLWCTSCHSIEKMCPAEDEVLAGDTTVHFPETAQCDHASVHCPSGFEGTVDRDCLCGNATWDSVSGSCIGILNSQPT